MFGLLTKHRTEYYDTTDGAKTSFQKDTDSISGYDTKRQLIIIIIMSLPVSFLHQR